jgi:hypothetical protein
MVQLEKGLRWSPENQRSSALGDGEVRNSSRHRSAITATCVVAAQLLSCESRVVIASWSCPPKAEPGLLAAAGAGGTADATNTNGAAGSANMPAGEAPVEFPWSTGFEDGFCDYSESAGFCWPPTATKRIVADPVHSGKYAAEYSVVSSSDRDAGQSRCVLRGAFPTEANYGAWYFIPSLTKRAALWNLFHFQGGNTTAEKFRDLWDVSLDIRDDGNPHLVLYNFGRAVLPDQTNTPPVPIGSWVHIELHVKRASDTTGEFTLYQDGTAIVLVTGVATDDTKLGQWFVGNLADDMDPAESTLYVDDVTLKPNR